MSINEGPFHEQSESIVESPVADSVVQQGYVQQGYVQQGYVQPGYVQPGYVQPGYVQPGYVQPGYVEAPLAATPMVAAPVAGARVRRAYTSHFEPDAVIAALVGLALLLVGLIAVTRGGFDGKMSVPVVNVLGFTHTTTLGLIEVVLGLCLLAAGVTRSRSGAMFFGAVLGVGGFVGAVQTKSFTKSLALESSMAWLTVVAGVIVVLSALLLPRYARRSTIVEAV